MSRWSDIPANLRGYDWAWQKRAKRILAGEPLCRACLDLGIATIATEVDHILPKAKGGTDEEDNLQPLCTPCHIAKTIAEAGRHSSSHPSWLKPSAIPLTLISGPPCAGKSTFAQQQAQTGDLVIDLDSLIRKYSPQHLQWQSPVSPDILSQAIRDRNALLGTLAQAKTGQAWLIVAAPAQAERDWWTAQLSAQAILLDPGPAECKARALARGTPRAIPGIERWYASAAANDWKPPQRKAKPKAPPIGTDGWPVKAATA